MVKDLTERQKREQVAYQFQVQAAGMGFTILSNGTNFTYRLHDAQLDADLTAIVLQCSFDFYEYRLNRGKQRVDMLLVQRHNAVCPIPVLELSSGEMFTSGAHPHIERSDRKRRNSEEVNLLVSKIILGFNGVQQELDEMEPRTRQRYLQLRDEYLCARVGRPWASRKKPVE